MVRKQVEKSSIGIIKNPTTVKLLAKEIITASDAYIAKQMDEKQYRELILHMLHIMVRNFLGQMVA